VVSLLDIIGPVMVGPSSSHTAGACRLGLLARNLVGGTPETARIELHGSFARTGEGHGTDKAIAGGLMGFRPDDERLRDALEIAQGEGLNDYAVEVSGAYHTIVLIAEDVKGSVAAIATILAEHGINIANLRLTRKQRGGDAFMVIEVDDAPGEPVRDEIRSLNWVRWAFRLDKVSG
jgi:L-serine dehydratase